MFSDPLSLRRVAGTFALIGIELALRRTAAIATNPHFQLLQIEVLFAIFDGQGDIAWPAKLFISPDCQIAIEK